MADSVQSEGGKARAAKLSPAERRRISQQAAERRWHGQNTELIVWRNGDVLVQVPVDIDIDTWNRLLNYIHILKPK